jgi:DNA-binding NarL/FixJ family response regulator
VSPLVYVTDVEDVGVAAHGAGRHPGLRQLPPLSSLLSEGALVGGAERFARGDQDTDRAAEVSAHLALLAQHSGLTPRDVVVLGFLALGWTTADIARELAYAESTIKKEVHFIVHRLGARNRTHAVAMAIRGAVI